MKYAGILIGLIGSGMLEYFAGWHVWLPVFIMMWGNNIYEEYR